MPIRIFLVEDHPVMREAYALVLEREPDVEVCGMAETAEECLAVLDGTPCDLLVTDLSLPGMDGVALLEHIRDERPDLPGIVISAHDEASHGERVRRAGARAYLNKRDIARRLAPTIRRVVEEGSVSA